MTNIRMKFLFRNKFYILVNIDEIYELNTLLYVI